MMDDDSSTYNRALGGAVRIGMHRPDPMPLHRSSLDGPSRAAILLLSLGPDVAAEMLKVFSPAEAQRVSSLMASVRTLERDVIVEVLQDFKAVTEHDREIPFDPENFMRSMLTRFTSESDEQGWRIDSEITRNLPALEALSIMRPDMLHRYMRTEHPQVVATLLALLPPELSASVLELFDAQLREELVLRVALLDRVNPNVLSELNEVIEQALTPENLMQMSGVGGVTPAVEILNNFAGDADRQVIESIRQHDPKLADDIKKKMFIFEDFGLIEPHVLERLLPELPFESLSVALKAASPSLRDHFFANMTKTMASNLRVEMDGLPPKSAQEVLAQQRYVVRVARQVAEQKKLSLDREPAQALAST